MKTVSEDMTVEEFFKENQHIRFSRIPVFQDEVDNITGLVLKDDIFREMANDNNTKRLTDIKRNIIVINRSLAIPKLLDQLVNSKNHMALVVDEFGSVSGIVTMEDVIETLLGFEIMDESDNVANLQHLARKSWEARAKRLGIIEDTDNIE
jgi:CBS domain containing-hemolysin-like protein